MNVHALLKKLHPLLFAVNRCLATGLFSASLLTETTLPDRSQERLTAATGHYAKLQQLDPQPAAANLPIDAKRWTTNPKFIEKVEKIKPEFVQVPLETYALPPCPANSSKQTRGEIDYLLRLHASRTEEEGKRALFSLPGVTAQVSNVGTQALNRSSETFFT